MCFLCTNITIYQPIDRIEPLFLCFFAHLKTSKHIYEKLLPFCIFDTDLEIKFSGKIKRVDRFFSLNFEQECYLYAVNQTSN
jgi:hypothetical protein